MKVVLQNVDGNANQLQSILVDVCLSNPCTAGWLCFPDGDDDYTCQCPDGYAGTNCQCNVVYTIVMPTKYTNVVNYS